MQHVARVLDAVFGRLLRRGEPVVPGAVEVFETARAVVQLIALTGDDGLLLGHAAGKEDQTVRTDTGRGWSMDISHALTKGLYKITRVV